jgi:hypothetical protein
LHITIIKVVNITGGYTIFAGGTTTFYSLEVKELARPVLLSFVCEVTVQVFPVSVKKLMILSFPGFGLLGLLNGLIHHLFFDSKNYQLIKLFV